MEDLRPDSFVAVAPQVFRAGYTERVSVSLFNGDRPAQGVARVTLIDRSGPVASAEATVPGSGEIALPITQLAPGPYQLEVRVDGVASRWASVQIEGRLVIFLETDKPVYKPGQTVRMRLLTMDALLKPQTTPAVIEIQDAKGIKIFRKSVETDGYGMAAVDLPLSTEPNLGVWKITARADQQETQLDVRVEEYVLPKYEVRVDTERGWVLAGDPVEGVVSGEYTFGKPVVGDVEIVALRYVGVWEEYARLNAPLDGDTAFELPPVGYAAGVAGAGGRGNVRLDVTVHEKGTGYSEKTTRLLTVAAAPVTLKVIPESGVFKPGLGMSYLVLTEDPGGAPVDARVRLRFEYLGKDFRNLVAPTMTVATSNGRAIAKAVAPADAAAMTLQAGADGAYTSLSLRSGHSPSGSFIHVEQLTGGEVEVGDIVRFRVDATREASRFYYEVLSRNGVALTGVSAGPDIEFTATHSMAPSSRILVYQVLPNNEVAADFLPFGVRGAYEHDVHVGFDRAEARPGDPVAINVRTEGEARVGLVAVDKSVFILAEDRLNLQQVFDELERLYVAPRVELHEALPFDVITTRGASETFKDAGAVVLTNKAVPSGTEHWKPIPTLSAGVTAMPMATPAPAPTPTPQAMMAAAPAPEGPRGASGADGLAEPPRTRRFFPETWIWEHAVTDEQGHAALAVEAPDSITTWMLRAVGMSKEHGLGMGEAELRVFQPFFLTADLPFSAIRGEEFPVKIALFNYLETPQEVFVEIEDAGWFDLLDESSKSVTIGPNDTGGVQFMIRPTVLGGNPVTINARSAEAADAVSKVLLIESEGVEVETVENHVLSAGRGPELRTDIPLGAVEGSGRAYIAVTGSLLTQTIDGLEQLLRMPFGCGEQNMVLFAPNVYVARYLEETGRSKPEILAKAEHLMTVGYQRQMTYRRADGSFSAFGDSDAEGSLWLTAFVMKTFAQAEAFTYIDPSVIEEAAEWIERRQVTDGSFEHVGFLHHQELLGGIQGRDALTAYVAAALLETGRAVAANRAVRYLEGTVNEIDSPYAMAVASYALHLADSPRKEQAHERLMSMARTDDGAFYWGVEGRSAAIENTAYALLALLERGDLAHASQAAKWLAGQRNALGGFGSTQDTVVSLQGLTSLSTRVQADTDMTVTLESGGWRKDVRVTPENADVLQLLEVPLGGVIAVTAEGEGSAVLQSVVRYNAPAPAKKPNVFNIDVDYGVDQVAVNDLITIAVDVRFTPPEPIESGMVVVDVAVPTGFEPVRDSIAAVAEGGGPVKRFDIAGRKVILYVEDMTPGSAVGFEFLARAKHPVRAKAVVSQAYSYYQPEHRGETLGGEITVTE